MNAMEPIGMAWASWVKDDFPRWDNTPDAKTGQPLGYSLGDSPLASKYLFAGKAAAEGEPQNDVSRRDQAEECSEVIAAWEAGMVRLKESAPVLWSVGLGYYLGEVPVGFRSAAKGRRRNRFRVDDANGMKVARRERLPHIEGEGRMAWKRRIGRRLLLTPRVFDIKLDLFHERMAGWIDGKIYD